MKNDKWKVVPGSQIISESSSRVLLWDLDGTLVRGKRYGVFKDYTIPMLERVFGTAGLFGDIMVFCMNGFPIVGKGVGGKSNTPAPKNAPPGGKLPCFIEKIKNAPPHGSPTIHAKHGGR